jgi:hypothetical protein
LPLAQDQLIQPGEIMVSSDLAHPVTVNAAVAPLRASDIVPGIPLRLISLSHRSPIQAPAGGLLPFEISMAPVDRVRADIVVDRKPVLTYLDPRDPQAAAHVLSGLFLMVWMSERAIRASEDTGKAQFRRSGVLHSAGAPQPGICKLLVDGQLVAEETFQAPGPYKLAAPFQMANGTATVTVTVDKTHSAAGDQRKLGMVVTGLGFR